MLPLYARANDVLHTGEDALTMVCDALVEGHELVEVVEQPLQRCLVLVVADFIDADRHHRRRVEVLLEDRLVDAAQRREHRLYW